ncbi:MAG: hypothetical protein F6K49_49015 [Moorea sp. SIO3I6]|nr:hypothetical protein [Moorena sp. SIO3I6]
MSVDRTTWEFGSQCYNILTLGIVHEGVAFRVLWWILKKKGNSNSDERMRLIEQFYKIFPDAQGKLLVRRPRVHWVLPGCAIYGSCHQCHFD